MLVKKEVNVYSFQFWSGAKDTIEELTLEERETVWNYLEEAYQGEASEGEINDFVWFEREFIASLLGYNSFDEIMERNREADN